VLVLLMLCGIGVFFALRSSDSTVPPSSTSLPSGATQPSPSPTAFTGDLRTLLLTPPKTSRPFVNPMSKDGTLSQQQAASTFDDPNQASTVLTDDNFVAGAVLQWHDSNETQVTIELLQFDGPADAQNWFRFDARGYEGDSTFTDQSPIEGVAGSSMFVANKPDSDGLVMSVGLAWHGSIYMAFVVWQPDKQDKAAAVNLMTQQFSRLP
jgi:hypothetical protein